MSNPWLTIPLEDYEGHMNSSEVGQAKILAELFAFALDQCRPESVVLIGVAGGNGLQAIDSSITKRIVGVDINPDYLKAVEQRFGQLPGLELLCLDLTAAGICLPQAALVHVALVFEHTGLSEALDKALSAVAVDGQFSIVLQLPSTQQQAVAFTPYVSIQRLRPKFALIDTDDFKRSLESRGLELMKQETRSAVGGKALWLGVFTRANPS